MATQAESNHISWTQSQSADVDPDVALARAKKCSVAGSKVEGQWVYSETVFNRNFALSEDDAAWNEGRFFCGLDGSIVQLANGKPKDPIQVLPEDMDEFHQILVDIHNVPVDQILQFKLESSQRSQKGDSQND